MIEQIYSYDQVSQLRPASRGQTLLLASDQNVQATPTFLKARARYPEVTEKSLRAVSYNPKLKHTNNGMLSPIDFEERQLKLQQEGVWKLGTTSRATALTIIRPDLLRQPWNVAARGCA